MAAAKYFQVRASEGVLLNLIGAAYSDMGEAQQAAEYYQKALAIARETGDQNSESSARLGRLGCSLNDEPYVVPVNYWYEGDSVFIHSLPGRKLEMLRANLHACLQVDEISDAYHWRSVIAFGHYEEVTEPAERERVLSELFKRLPHLSPVESRMTKGIDQTVVFRLRLARVTGVAEDWR